MLTESDKLNEIIQEWEGKHNTINSKWCGKRLKEIIDKYIKK